MNLFEFQKEHQAWALKNFGQHEAWQPLLGIIEELGEYEEARAKGDIPEVLDAIGDVMIFMADYCSCEGFLLETIVSNARTRILDSTLLIWGGKLCHHHLKKEQNIRGEQSAHRADIKVVLTYIVGILDIQARLLGTSVVDVTTKTWETVKQRDWTLVAKS